MKRNILYILIAAIAFTACESAPDTSISDVKLNKSSLMLMNIGDTERLSANVVPQTAPNQKVSWTSEYDTVASVDNNGLVKAVSEGKTIITVTTEEGEKTAICEVTVSWLGEVSFKSDKTWEMGTQTWSDVVMAGRCKKDDFDGGAQFNYKVDCRQNEGYGDLFSWRLVDEYKAVLCPDGWRVPDTDDFVALDLALGGTGENEQNSETLRDAYLNTWGGQYTGYAHKEFIYSTENAYYWSQTPQDVGYGDYNYALSFRPSGLVNPQYHDSTSYGFMVRCVR